MNELQLSGQQVDIITYVLDDDYEELHLLANYLHQVEGCRFKMYTDIEEFIEAIEQGVHICIIDHNLLAPIDGIEVGKKVLEKNSLAFLILFSGSACIKVWQEATNSGFRGLIDKNDEDAFGQVARMVEREMKGIRERIDRYEALKTLNEKYKQYL